MKNLKIPLNTGSLTWPDPFSYRALLITDCKRPCENGLVQVQYQNNSDTPAQMHGVNMVQLNLNLKIYIHVTQEFLDKILMPLTSFM